MIEQVRSIRKQRHDYRNAAGEALPGVSTIVGLRAKPGLMHWAFRVGAANPNLSSIKDYVDDLARIGSCAHEIISAQLSRRAADLRDYTANEIDAAGIPVAKFRDWYGRHEIRLIASERSLVSEQHQFGGTLDAFALIDGVATVLDFKTGRRIYNDMFMQVAAYAELLREAGEAVAQICILQIGRTGAEGFTEAARSTWEIPWLKFLALRRLYELERAEDRDALGLVSTSD